MNNDNSKIAKNTLFLYIRMLVVLGISLYTTRVVLNILGIVDYGIYNIVCGFVSMFAFLNNSLANGVQRFLNFKRGKGSLDEIPDVYSASLAIMVILIIIVFCVLETLGVWYIYNKMIIPAERFEAAFWIFQCSVVSLIFVILQVPYSAAILAFERMDFYAFVSIIEAILKLLIVLFLPYSTFDNLVLYGILSLLVSACNFILYFSYSKKHFNKELQLKRIQNRTLFKEITTFSGWNVFGTFAYMIKDQGLNVLLNAFFGPVINAAKGVAMQVNSALQGFSTNIVAAIRPQLVQSYSAGNVERVENLMFSLSRLIFVMLFVLSLPIIMELNFILHIWLSDSIPEYTIIFTDLVLINMIITSMNTPLSQVVHATGRMRNYQVCTSFVIITILPISWILLEFGFSSVSTFVVCIIVSILNQGICLFLLRKIFPFSIKSYVVKIIVPCIGLSVISLIVPIAIKAFISEGYFRLLFNTSTTVFVTALLSYLVVFTKDERRMMNEFIKRFFGKRI